MKPKTLTIDEVLAQYEGDLTEEQIAQIKSSAMPIRELGDEIKLTVKEDYGQGWDKLKKKLHINYKQNK